MQDYAELAGFSSYYLEDSWVLDIEAHPGTLIVRLELVLLPEHPAYAPPPTDAYCYRIGTIRFEGIEHLSWTQGALVDRSTDLDGSIDYGNIESLTWKSNEYHLSGGFGRIEVLARMVKVELSP